MVSDVSLRKYVVDRSIIEKIIRFQANFASTLSQIPPEKIALDLVNPVKARNQAELLEQFIPLTDKKLLEIGTGCGMNLIVWAKEYGADVFGIEPDATAFNGSISVARELFQQNGLSPIPIFSAIGEQLPFPDDSFDIVYSTNVLEHTGNPVQVISEAMRVLKPGGVLQFVYPNYHSFFDGHYAVFHPPVLFSGFFQLYIRFIIRKDPSFAKTLRTELNLRWTQAMIAKLKSIYEIEILSLGDEIFKERMATANFESWAGLFKVKKLVILARRLKLDKILASLMLLSRTWTPVILTLRKIR